MFFKRNKFLIVIIFITLCAFIAHIFFKHDTPIIIETAGDLKLAVVSDIHVLGNNSDEEDVSLDIMDALKLDLLKEDINLLVLCGDNTNSSRPWQNEALKNKLYEIEDSGIKVILIPGNHDIGLLKKEDFKDYYKDFGYADAYSLDLKSLSYSYLINDHMILMLDTDGYTDYRYAELTHSTLKWIRKQLEIAEKNNLKVITVGHFPLLAEHGTEFIGKDAAISLFKEYNMPLYISGHLHNRNVNRSLKLTELVIDKFTSSPCNYGIIQINEEEIIYNPKSLDLNAYGLNRFVEESFEAALKMGDYVVDALCADYPEITEDEKKAASDYFVKLMSYLSDGTVYRNMDYLNKHAGSDIFKYIAENSNYGPWLPELFKNANPYTEGFVQKNGEIKILEAN